MKVSFDANADPPGPVRSDLPNISSTYLLVSVMPGDIEISGSDVIHASGRRQ